MLPHHVRHAENNPQIYKLITDYLSKKPWTSLSKLFKEGVNGNTTVTNPLAATSFTAAILNEMVKAETVIVRMRRNGARAFALYAMPDADTSDAALPPSARSTDQRQNRKVQAAFEAAQIAAHGAGQGN